MYQQQGLILELSEINSIRHVVLRDGDSAVAKAIGTSRLAVVRACAGLPLHGSTVVPIRRYSAVAEAAELNI